MGKSTIYYFYGHFHRILQGMDPKRKKFGLDFDCKTMAGSNCHIDSEKNLLCPTHCWWVSVLCIIPH